MEQATMNRPKPSQINHGLDHASPFVGCFNKTEREIAAALYVEACIRDGDEWKPKGPRDIGGAMFLMVAELPADRVSDDLLKMVGEMLLKQELTARTEKRNVSWISFMIHTGLTPDVLGLVKDGFFTMDGEHGPVMPTDLFFTKLDEKGYVRAG